MVILALSLAALVGLSLGMLGGGGAILTVPIFVYVLGFGTKQAIAMTLAVVGATSIAGAVGHWRAGNVRLSTAALFGGIAMLGAFAGARLSAFLTGSAQLTILALVMLVSATMMFRNAGRASRETSPAQGMSQGLMLLAGLAVGLLTGLVGIGGGFLVVPALVLLAGLPMKEAVGTSLVVIAMNSASGFLGYLGQVSVPWGFVALFTSVAIGGILAGTRLVRFVSPESLKRGFAVFLLLIGTLVLYQNRATLLARPAPPVSPAP